MTVAPEDDADGDRRERTPAADDGGVRLTWLGHSSVVIELAGVRLLTDPLLRRRTGPLVRSDPAPDRRHWHDPDAVLLSHLHHDHADLASLRRLGGAPVLSGLGNRDWLANRGLTVAGQVDRPDPSDAEGGSMADDDAWWTVPDPRPAQPEGRPGLSRGAVSVRLVKAVHESRRMPHRPNDTHGFLVRSTELVVYFAGDTALYDEMADLAELAGRAIDVAVLPIGGWGPVLSNGHLGPATAAEAAARIGARAVLPVHYGTLHLWGWPRPFLGWKHAPLASFIRDVREAAPGARLCATALGETTTVFPQS